MRRMPISPKLQSTTTCLRGIMSRLRRFIAKACKIHSIQRSKKSVLYSVDYDTSNPIETRKYLRTYGLIPPGVDTFENQSKRCENDSIETLDNTD